MSKIKSDIVGYRLHEGRPENDELVLVDIGHSHPLYCQYDSKDDEFYQITQGHPKVDWKQILGWAYIPNIIYTS